MQTLGTSQEHIFFLQLKQSDGAISKLLHHQIRKFLLFSISLGSFWGRALGQAGVSCGARSWWGSSTGVKCRSGCPAPCWSCCPLVASACSDSGPGVKLSCMLQARPGAQTHLQVKVHTPDQGNGEPAMNIVQVHIQSPCCQLHAQESCCKSTASAKPSLLPFVKNSLVKSLCQFLPLTSFSVYIVKQLTFSAVLLFTTLCHR